MRMNAATDSVDFQNPYALQRERQYAAYQELLQRLPAGPLYDATYKKMMQYRAGGSTQAASITNQVRNANPVLNRQSVPASRSIPVVSAPIKQNIPSNDIPDVWRSIMKGMRGMHGVHGMGQFEIASAALKLLGPAIGGGANGTGGNVPQNVNTVSTSVQTNVSPQISPVFVQQDNPSNSPVSTGVTQTAPVPMSATFPGQPSFQNPSPYGTTPITGAIPGFDMASGFAPTGTPAISSLLPQQSSISPGTMLAIAALLGGALYLRHRRKKNRTN